jgi:hypothetical protein
LLDRESFEIIPTKDHTRHAWRNGFSSSDGESSKRWGLTTDSHFGHRPTLMPQRLWGADSRCPGSIELAQRLVGFRGQ